MHAKAKSSAESPQSSPGSVTSATANPEHPFKHGRIPNVVSRNFLFSVNLQTEQCLHHPGKKICFLAKC